MLFGTCQIRIAQSPHCLACWHGHSTCRSTPARASKRCRQIPQSRWSPDMTAPETARARRSPAATLACSPPLDVRVPLSSNVPLRLFFFRFERLVRLRSTTVEGGRALARRGEKLRRALSARVLVRAAVSRRRRRAAEEADSSLRAGGSLRLRPQEPAEWPDAASLGTKNARIARRVSHVAAERTAPVVALAHRRLARRAFAKALGEGAGGDERRPQFRRSRRRRSRRSAARRYRAAPPRPRSRRRPFASSAPALATLGASLQAHLHVLLQQHLCTSFAHTGHRWNRERWFGENMPCRDGRDGPLNRVRGADARGPVPPAKPRGRAPLPRGSSSSFVAARRGFFKRRAAYQNLRRAARHDHAKRKGKDFISFLQARATRRRAADATDALSLSHVRSLHLDVGVRLEPGRRPRPASGANARARGAPSRARRVPRPSADEGQERLGRGPPARRRGRDRRGRRARRVRTRRRASERVRRRPVPDERAPEEPPERCARAASPTRPVARLAFFSRSRTTLTYVASLLGVGERHPSVDAFGRERRKKKCSCATNPKLTRALSSSSEPQSSPSPTRSSARTSPFGSRAWRLTTSTWWAPWFWARRWGSSAAPWAGTKRGKKASRCRS